MITERGAQLVRDCENALRGLVAEAASAGNYEAVLRLTCWARELATLINPRVPAVESTRHAAASGKTKGSQVSKGPKRKPISEYPRFFRRGNALFKIGWSKREKSEYQHKSSLAVLQTVAGALAKAGVDGRIFTTESFMPLHATGDDDSVIPDYQVYVCLAFLRHLGMVEQHGRQGYSLPDVADLNHAVEAAWQGLLEG